MRPAIGLEAHGLLAPPGRPGIPRGPQTVAEVLDRGVVDDPNGDALVGRSGRFTYAELDRAANRATHALEGLGVAPGDRVAVCLANDVDIVLAFLGAMRLGAIWVGINRPLAPKEKAFLLDDSGAKIFIGEPDTFRTLDHAGTLSLEEWRERVSAAAEGRPTTDVDPFAPAAIAYTSGTTGHPKGAVHSQHNLLLPGAVAAATGAYGPDVRQGVLLPLTILNLMVLVPVLAFQDRSCCVVMDRVDPEGIAEWVRTERVGHFAAVPTIYHDLLTHPAVRPEDLSSLIRPEVGGAECPEEFRDLYRERFGSEVTIGYGMTEAPTAVTRSDAKGSPRPGLCGRAVPQVRIEIRDEAGGVPPSGEVGEICVGPAEEGPWAGIYTPMLGYWNQPEATTEALRGGLYHSGDLGFLDAEGDLFIRGRRNDLILRGGANVYPAEVERVLQGDPRVADCAVLGVPDPRLGQRVVAVVQLSDGANAYNDELRDVCAAELARYKIPVEVRFVDGLPRNAMGKIVKRELGPLFGLRLEV